MGHQWALQELSSNLQDSATWEVAGQVGWTYLTVLRVNMDQALPDTTQLHTLQEKQETLEWYVHNLETKVCEPGWFMASKTEIMESEEEPEEKAPLQDLTMLQEKVKHEKTWTSDGQAVGI